MTATRTLRLTVPQLRMVNEALALLEADDHDVLPYDQNVMDRTRRIVFDAIGDDE